MKETSTKYGTICTSDAVVRSDQRARKMTFVASDSTRDSAGTVLNQDGWDLKRYNRNGIVGYQHKVYGSGSDTDNPDNIIGKGHAYTETDGRGRKRLLVDVEFEPEGLNPLADKVYKKLQFGTLKAVSVGFRALGSGHFGKGDEAAGGRNETYYYAGQELLEISVVNIPANPNALKKSASRPDPVPVSGKMAEEKARALKLADAALALSSEPRTRTSARARILAQAAKVLEEKQ